MKTLKPLATILLFSSLIPLYAKGQEKQNKGLTYENVRLFNSVDVKRGDAILIDAPMFKPLSGTWHYEHVYSDFWAEAPFRSPKLGGNGKYNCTIKALFSQPQSSDIFVYAKFPDATKPLFVDLKAALWSGEVELPGSSIVSSFNVYFQYLKSLRSITDDDVIYYLNAFDPMQEGKNEFEKRKAIDKGTEQLTKLKGAAVNHIDQVAFFTINVGEYDFNKKGFLTKGLIGSEHFDIELSKGIKKLGVDFKNITDQLFIKVDENKAEEVTTKYLEKTNRELYCVYILDYTDYKITSSVMKDMFGNGTVGKTFVQNAVVKRIDFYLDKECTEKLSTINL